MKRITYFLIVVMIMTICGCGKNPMVTKLSQIDKGKRYRNEGFKALISVWSNHVLIFFEFLPSSYYNNIPVGRIYSMSFQDNEGWIYARDTKDFNNNYIKVRYLKKTDNTPILSKDISMEDVGKMEAITYRDDDKFTFYLKNEIVNISSYGDHPITGRGEYKIKDGIIVAINYENTTVGYMISSKNIGGHIINSGTIKASVDKYLFVLTYKNDYHATGPITYNGRQIGEIWGLFDISGVPGIYSGYYTDERGRHQSDVAWTDWDKIGE